MANNVTNYVEIIGNPMVIEKMDNLFQKSEEGPYNENLVRFVKTFWGESCEGIDGGSTKNLWMLDNAGAKWVYTENNIDEGHWNIQSANYPPVEFFIQLYKLAQEFDPSVEIKVKFQDESFEPVGGFSAKRDHEGVARYHLQENYELEEPEFDYDDEDYDDDQSSWYEEVDDIQNDCWSYATDECWSGEAKEIEGLKKIEKYMDLYK